MQMDSANAGFDIFDETNDYDKRPSGVADASDFIVDVREYDVPYHVRVAIDKGTRARYQFLIAQTKNRRHSHWEVVLGGGETRSYITHMPGRTFDACRSCCHGLRY
jgi:DNA polymerase elongation subunit (family B)